MDKATLVTADLAVGQRIVDILDDLGLRVEVAMWLLTPDYDDWRFAVSSRELDRVDPLAAYGLVHDSLHKGGVELENTPPLLLLRTSDPFIRMLRRTFGKAKSIEGMRLGGQTVGDRFIEDAVIYCIR